MCSYKEHIERSNFFVVLDGSKCCWKKVKNGLLQGSVLAPLLFDVNTND